MADSDTGDKTEKPTPKRLEDARKKGDVVKSREITSTAASAGCWASRRAASARSPTGRKPALACQ